MANTTLQHPAHTARPGPYHGVETALDYGDPAAELAALRTQCGIFELPWRAKVVIAGKDRVRWLHNMVTNNVRDLLLNRGAYNFVLNAQGRILGDMYIFNRGESLLIDTDRAQVDPLLAAMKRFIIMDKVEMSVAEGINAVGVCGPKAAEVLASVGLDTRDLAALELRDQQVDGSNATLVRGPEAKPGWYELWIEKVEKNAATLTAVREKLVAAGARPIGAQALEWWRILHGIPHYGQDIRDRDLPQETGQAQALSFTKGCYIGQEIVERIRSRGQVHRAFAGFEIEGDPPSPGRFDAEGRTLVEITSIARVPAQSGEKTLALGYVRREIAVDGKVELSGLKARIVELPFAV